MCRGLLSIVLLLALGGGARGQSWAEKMFSQTAHDFGTVALGADVEHRFVFENLYLEDVQIASAEATCGCTLVSVPKPLLKSRQRGEIVAKLDTRGGFTGYKNVTINVRFNRPYAAVVQLHVNSFIRQDVMVVPGEVSFGAVPAAAGATRRLRVSYYGQGEWRIVDIRSFCGHLEAALREVYRGRFAQANQPTVVYDLDVRLKGNAPAGPLKEAIFLVTNDASPSAARVPLVVEGTVLAPLTVTPSSLLLGVVRPGQTVTKPLVVRGQKPFRILEAAGPSTRFKFAASDAQQAIHVLNVTFTAPAEAGRVTGTIRIRTDLPGSEVSDLAVEGEVAEAAAGPPPGDWPAPGKGDEALQPRAPGTAAGR